MPDRDHHCLWYLQNMKEPLSGQHLCRRQFQLHQLTSPQGAHWEERRMSKVEQPQPFCLVFFREKEKQLDRGSGWFVMPGSVHRTGETSMRTVALPSQQQEVCYGLGAVHFCHTGNLGGLLPQA